MQPNTCTNKVFSKHSLVHLQDLIPTFAGVVAYTVYFIPAKVGIKSCRCKRECFIRPGVCRPQDTPGFLELLLSVNVCMHVCVRVRLRVCLPLRLLITSGMMWFDIDSYDWLKG